MAAVPQSLSTTLMPSSTSAILPQEWCPARQERGLCLSEAYHLAWLLPVPLLAGEGQGGVKNIFMYQCIQLPETMRHACNNTLVWAVLVTLAVLWPLQEILSARASGISSSLPAWVSMLAEWRPNTYSFTTDGVPGIFTYGRSRCRPPAIIYLLCNFRRVTQIFLSLL